MKRFLIYYNFIIVSVMVVAGFLTATTYIQLAVAVLFFPLLAYFAGKVVPKRNRAINLPTPSAKAVVMKKAETPEITKLKKEGVDIDRRAFLKLIGTAGLSLFMFAMFTKKAEAAFFGSVPGPGTVSIKDSLGVKIDPAEKHPTDGYNITELDDSTPAYYGFVNKTGAWFIMKEDSTATPYYSYVKGSSDFTNAVTGWPNRASLSYGYFDNVF